MMVFQNQACVSINNAYLFSKLLLKFALLSFHHESNNSENPVSLGAKTFEAGGL
jgi:hypothetical protein